MVEGITSDASVASEIATAIVQSLDGAASGGAISSDTETTVAGNTNAQAAIQSMTGAQDTIIQVIGQASANLQTVASEFKAADKVTRQLLSALVVPPCIGGGKK